MPHNSRQRWIWKLETGGDIEVPWTTALEAYRRMWPEAEVHRVRDVPGVEAVTPNDLLLATEEGTIHLAQRFRKPRHHGIDFSLVTEPRDGGRSEWLACKQAHDPEHPATGPSLFALGIARDREHPGRHGFRQLHLVRLEPVVRELFGTDHEQGRDGDPLEAGGEEFWVYPWSSLREVGAIYRSFGPDVLQPDTQKQPVDPLAWGDRETPGHHVERITGNPTYATR